LKRNARNGQLFWNQREFARRKWTKQKEKNKQEFCAPRHKCRSRW
jgi:hypothetical protein